MSSIPEQSGVSPPHPPLIALVDANNFFVSCERLFRPDLVTTPVVVLSSNDGCVISRSNEAKALGFQMGAPFFQVKDLCEIHGVAVFSSNFSLYQDISARLIHLLRRFTDTLEEYSIDEAFLVVRMGNVTPAALSTFQSASTDPPHVQYRHALDTYARRIRASVFQEVGIPVSVGIAPTKTLAKVATHRAKHECAYGGVCVLHTAEEISSALTYTPIADVWGIGRQYAPALLATGVRTAQDFVARSDMWIRARIGIHGIRTTHELRGHSCFPVGAMRGLRKSLFHSHSFGTPTTHRSVIEGALSYHARTVAEMLRAEHAVARTISVHLFSARKVGGRAPTVATTTLPIPTNDTLLMVRTVHTLARRLYLKGVRYKKAGVSVCDIVHEESVPTRTLFGEKHDARASLMDALDTLRCRFGDAIRMADEGGVTTWHARHTMRSPSYTTHWHAIPVVQVPPQ